VTALALKTITRPPGRRDGGKKQPAVVTIGASCLARPDVLARGRKFLLELPDALLEDAPAVLIVC